MKTSSGKIAVFVTAPSMDEARAIVREILNKRLAACANIISSMESHYWWEGKIHQENEVLIIMKTTSELFSALEKAVRSLHTYEVPEIIALPVTDGSESYLKWIADETVNH